MQLRAWWSQVRDRLDNRLIVRPLLFVAVAVVGSQISLAVDRRLADDALPSILETSVDSADSILSTIAGGLITAITLLLSLVLVSVQLASSQFSPRTLRDWIGDTTQQRTIGVVLGTTVYCLLVLRETRSLGESISLAPHTSVLLAVLLAVVSLVAVVRSVDHLSHSMRIGAVARNLAQETLESLRSLADQPDLASRPVPADRERPRLEEGTPFVARSSGWIERIELDALREALDPDTHVSLLVGPGAFVYEGQALAWCDTDTGLDLESIESPVFTIGDTRLISQDVSFGLLQMSDIALRAISPGVNDPNTAVDVVAHMGIVLLEAWSQQRAPTQLHLDDNITVDVIAAHHEEYLDIAFSQILRYSPHEFEVLRAMDRTLETLITEVERRELPGPLGPLCEMREEIRATVERSDLSDRDKARFG